MLYCTDGSIGSDDHDYTKKEAREKDQRAEETKISVVSGMACVSCRKCRCESVSQNFLDAAGQTSHWSWATQVRGWLARHNGQIWDGSMNQVAFVHTSASTSTVQYSTSMGSHELSRVEVIVQMEVNVPYSVPCLALVEVRGNGSLRRRGCFWGCELPSLWDSLRRSHPVRWEEKKDWRWLMSEG
jgi:hypothetical protein